MKNATTGAPDRVWFSAGVKLNLGNYSSANVDIGMATELPCWRIALYRIEALRGTGQDRRLKE